MKNNRWSSVSLRLVIAIAAVLTLNPAAVQPASGHKYPPARITAFRGHAPVLLLSDADGQKILYDRGATTAFVPASLVKVMTAYAVLEQVKAGKVTLDHQVIVPAPLVARWKKWPRASSMRLRAGEKVSLDALMQGMITASGNDAAELLAVSVAGSLDAFVAQMNRTARRIGMTGSRFATVNGWPDGGKTMVTAADLSLLAGRLLRDHPDAYRRYFGARSMTRPGGVILLNRNPLLGRVAGADGLKTGHISSAGYALLGSVRRNGRRLIIVVAGASSEKQRGDEAVALIEAGFAAMNRPVVAGTKAPQR